MAHLINLEDISLLFRRSKAPPDLGRERFTPDQRRHKAPPDLGRERFTPKDFIKIRT